MSTKALKIIEKDGKAAKDKDPNLSDEHVLRKLYSGDADHAHHGRPRVEALQRQGQHRLLPGLGPGRRPATWAARMRCSTVTGSSRPTGSPAIMLLRGADIDDIVNEWFGNEGDTLQGSPDAGALQHAVGELRLDQLADRHPDQPRHGRRDGGEDPRRRHGLHDLHRATVAPAPTTSTAGSTSPASTSRRWCSCARTTTGRSRCRASGRPRRRRSPPRRRPTVCRAFASTATTSSRSTASARKRSIAPARARVRRWSRP